MVHGVLHIFIYYLLMLCYNIHTHTHLHIDRPKCPSHLPSRISSLALCTHPNVKIDGIKTRRFQLPETPALLPLPFTTYTQEKYMPPRRAPLDSKTKTKKVHENLAERENARNAPVISP